MINFNEAPFLGVELDLVRDAINKKHICGDGYFTKKCNSLLEKYINCQKVLLTNSCTAALEMASLMININYGDEIICPSYTFVTTASAFAIHGAKIVFVDIRDDTLNIDESKIEMAITPKTKAIVPVHYAGVCADMDKIREIAQEHHLYLVEDAAQALGSFYKGRVAGTMSDVGCYSFHETKNVACGEGGAIAVNNPTLIDSAEIVWEKGTDRSKFLRGQVDKYTWVALGSSYLPSDMIAAYLYPQLEIISKINECRFSLWNRYYDAFQSLIEHGVRLPYCPPECRHNAHMFYMRCPSMEIRSRFIRYMKEQGITCVFHYIPLHSSPAGKKYGRFIDDMRVTNSVSDTLVRLPLFYSLSEQQQDIIIDRTLQFWKKS